MWQYDWLFSSTEYQSCWRERFDTRLVPPHIRQWKKPRRELLFVDYEHLHPNLFHTSFVQRYFLTSTFGGDLSVLGFKLKVGPIPRYMSNFKINHFCLMKCCSYSMKIINLFISSNKVIEGWNSYLWCKNFTLISRTELGYQLILRQFIKI